MSEIQSYKDLIVWQRSIELVKEVYSILRLMPNDEKFGLTSQMKRSAISIPSNIAEGWGRMSPKDNLRFLRTARGSLFELETQLIVCKELELISDLQRANDFIVEVSKMLVVLINKLKQKYGV